jgi:hypothetical protein
VAFTVTELPSANVPAPLTVPRQVVQRVTRRQSMITYLLLLLVLVLPVPLLPIAVLH